MPIYEYICRECHNGFEMLVRASQPAACPSCSSTDLAKQLSVFAPSVKNGSAAALPMSACGACGDPRGPGACSLD